MFTKLLGFYSYKEDFNNSPPLTKRHAIFGSMVKAYMRIKCHNLITLITQKNAKSTFCVETESKLVEN